MTFCKGYGRFLRGISDTASWLDEYQVTANDLMDSKMSEDVALVNNLSIAEGQTLEILKQLQH